MLITWRSRSSFIELCDVIIAAYVVAHHNLNTSLDINSHNYHKIDTRNLRLRLVHGWHYMVRLVLVLRFGFIF